MFLVFLDSQLKHVWEDSSHKSKRWSPGLVKAIRKKIQLLANAYDERDLKNVRSLHFKKLKGDRAGTYSIRVNEQYRLILAFETDIEGRKVIIIEMVDYHP
ncbi:MAG: type II toxin-antitoxin system RelE/ParE family toxin [Corynebacterium matruchotii]|jgi:plasmid maintenance system killer